MKRSYPSITNWFGGIGFIILLILWALATMSNMGCDGGVGEAVAVDDVAADAAAAAAADAAAETTTAVVTETAIEGSTTVFDRRLHASNPSGNGLSATLWGREREISSAKDTLADLAMIKLDSVTQARSRYFPGGTAAISEAKANNCF